MDLKKSVILSQTEGGLSPSIHKFGNVFVYSGLSAE